MSSRPVKKESTEKRPSLFDEEQIARYATGSTRSAKSKGRDAHDPSLSADMTRKIIQVAREQMEDGREVPTIEIPSVPDAEDVDSSDEGSDVSVDLDNEDEEARKLFDIFKPTASQASVILTKQLKKTDVITDPKLMEVYRTLADLLRIYQVGKLPKAMNILASQTVAGWQELIEVTQPNNWTPAALKAVTNLFVNTASDGKCRKFFHDVLLEQVRRLLEGEKKVHRNVWDALIAASRRPKPFVYAILLPMAESTEISRKEARAISYIVTRSRLPRAFSNQFLVYITREGVEVSPTKTLFIARFVAKGQVLAIAAIDGILSYFLAYRGIQEEQPLIWHQALFTFVKNYGAELLPNQRDELEDLMNIHKHKIDDEIRRVLRETPPRGEFDRPPEETIAVLAPKYPPIA